MISPKIHILKTYKWLNGLFGKGLVISTAVIIVVGVVASATAYMLLNTAAPRSLTITGGPTGSSFQRHAERYQKILAREGVTLKILPSDGSADNLKRLADPKIKVDIGFVLAGEAEKKKLRQPDVARQRFTSASDGVLYRQAAPATFRVQG